MRNCASIHPLDLELETPDLYDERRESFDVLMGQLHAVSKSQSDGGGGTMGKVKRDLLVSMVGLLLVLSAGGCTIASGVWPVPQSHFSYPNSNVIPLGPGKGEATAMGFGPPDIMDVDLMEAAVQNAIRQKGGDLLVDYYLFYEIKTYLPFIYDITWRAEGTVAKMEIGKQKLR